MTAPNTPTDPCPSWCAGHNPDETATRTPRHHHSEPVRVGEQDDMLFRYAATVSLVWWTDEDAPRVYVGRHRTGGVDHDSSVQMPLRDAEAWTDILDGIDASELADAIRRTLALLDDEEAVK